MEDRFERATYGGSHRGLCWFYLLDGKPVTVWNPNDVVRERPSLHAVAELLWNYSEHRWTFQRFVGHRV